MLLKKRILPILVAVLMMFAMLPSVAYAANATMYYHTNGGLLDVGNGPVEDPEVVFDNFSGNTRSRDLDIDNGYLPTPTKEGDTFLGWYQNEAFSGNVVKQTYNMSGLSSSTSEYHLYAKWYGDGSASGTWGTCPWEIDADGVLTVYPGTGVNTVEDGYGGNSPGLLTPWTSYADQIKQVRFVTTEEGGETQYVVFPEIVNNLLTNMKNLESVDFSGVDASNCRYMRNFLFAYNGNKLTSVDLSAMKNAAPVGKCLRVAEQRQRHLSHLLNQLTDGRGQHMPAALHVTAKRAHDAHKQKAWRDAGIGKPALRRSHKRGDSA